MCDSWAPSHFLPGLANPNLLLGLREPNLCWEAGRWAGRGWTGSAGVGSSRVKSAGEQRAPAAPLVPSSAPPCAPARPPPPAACTRGGREVGALVSSGRPWWGWTQGGKGGQAGQAHSPGVTLIPSESSSAWGAQPRMLCQEERSQPSEQPPRAVPPLTTTPRPPLQRTSASAAASSARARSALLRVSAACSLSLAANAPPRARSRSSLLQVVEQQGGHRAEWMLAMLAVGSRERGAGPGHPCCRGRREQALF